MRKSTATTCRPIESRRFNSRAFTLIEVLVIAVIVVLMLGMALPVFRTITGSRSEAGAANHVAAMLGRARSDAIGLQKTIGVAFLLNNSSQIQSMAEVEFPDCAGWSSQVSYVPGNCVSYSTTVVNTTSPYYFCIAPQPAVGAFPGSPTWRQVGGPPLEIRPDTELIPLPAGIGIQTVCNCDINTASQVRKADGYLNVGVILFDGQGHIVSQSYGISRSSKLGVAAGLSADYPTVFSPGIYSGTDFGVPSQFGLVIYQREAFTAQGYAGKDVIYSSAPAQQTTDYTGATPAQKAEEDWLDQNATPLVINRYTGTLIKAE